ncbi:MAG TPA: cold shock domain-containing protein [Ruminiclostridium sp.]|nr:cold shock domain-containing protein [Ruminiclostridium sp.]
MIGTIKSFDNENRSGVISCESTGEEIQFSYPSIASANYKMFHPGQKVTFFVEQGSQDKNQHVATKVTAIE